MLQNRHSYAISNYNRLTANAYEAEDLSSGSNYVVHTLAPHGEAYIMWTTNTESVLSMDFSDNAVFMDMYGNSIKNEAETLTLTPQPVYAYIENPEYIKNYSDGNADVVLNIKENSKKAVVIKSEEDAMSDSFFDNILYFNQYEADENNNVVSSFNVKKSINPYVGYVSGENTYKTFKFSAFSRIWKNWRFTRITK